MKVIKLAFKFGAMLLAGKIKGASTPQYFNNEYIIAQNLTSEASSKLQKIDYRFGDNKTLDLKGYREAVNGFYECNGNEKARNMSNLWGSIIMMYGENHLDSKIPTLRGDYGGYLLESEDTSICDMEKIARNYRIVCDHIDQSKYDHKELLLSIAKTMQKAEELVEIIDPGSLKRIQSQANPVEKEIWKTNIWPYVNKLYKYAHQKREEVYSSLTPLKKNIINKAFNGFVDQFKKANKEHSSTKKSRDYKMALNAEKAIKQIGIEASYTIVVGNDHIPGIYNRIKKEFPRKPIVVCRPKSSKTRRILKP